jgi:hypothetical protein
MVSKATEWSASRLVHSFLDLGSWYRPIYGRASVFIADGCSQWATAVAYKTTEKSSRDIDIAVDALATAWLGIVGAPYRPANLNPSVNRDLDLNAAKAHEFWHSVNNERLHIS